MRDINEISSWYKKNNELCRNDQLKIKFLCLYTIVAYSVKNIELEYKELVVDFEKKDFNFGITEYDRDTTFSEEEIHILKTINRLYGYFENKDLLYHLSLNSNSISDIINHLKKEITEDLGSYKFYKFNEYVLITKKYIFFIDNNTNLTDEEVKYLKEYQYKGPEDQTQFTVFRSVSSGALVIY